MRSARIAVGLAVASLLLLAGCQRGRAPAAPAGPQTLAAVGPFRHAASGMDFPTDVGEFNRAALVQYDKAGRIVSARYEIDGAASKFVATVYVYPVTGSPLARAQRCQRLFDEASGELVRADPGAYSTGTDEVSLDQEGSAHAGRHATFLYDEITNGDRTPAAAQLYLFCDAAGPWQLEYRFTYPRELTVAPIIADFMRRLTWTLNPE